MAGIRYPQPLGGAVGESCSGSAGRDNGESEGTAVERGRSVVVHAPSGRGAGRAGPDSRRRLQWRSWHVERHPYRMRPQAYPPFPFISSSCT